MVVQPCNCTCTAGSSDSSQPTASSQPQHSLSVAAPAARGRGVEHSTEQHGVLVGLEGREVWSAGTGRHAATRQVQCSAS